MSPMVTFLTTPHSHGRKLGVEALAWGTACEISQRSTSVPSPTVPGPHPLKGNPQMPLHPWGTRCGSNVPLTEAPRDHSPPSLGGNPKVTLSHLFPMFYSELDHEVRCLLPHSNRFLTVHLALI